MVRVYTLPLGAYQTNCYVVHQESESRCIVIDPGYEAGSVLSFLEEKGLSLEAILLTHGHFDHIEAAPILRERYGAPIYIGSADGTKPFKVYNSMISSNANKYRRRGSKEPYVFIDRTPNSNNKCDG